MIYTNTKKMKKISFITEIRAPKQKVWETMLNPASYREWVAASWPGSYYEGKWEKGEHLKFLSPGRGGTMALVDDQKPFDYCMTHHVAVINADGTLDTESEGAKKWIGTVENYHLHEKNGGTELQVEIQTSPEWEKMFNDDLPKALARLKEICEQ